MKKHIAEVLLAVAFCGLAIAQDQPPPGQGPGQPTPLPSATRMFVRGPAMGPVGPGMGKWWKNSELMQKLGVSDAQVQKIEKIFQEHRLQLIDLHAALEKQEATLEPLIEADQPDEAQVVTQIDKVAQARANLEKSNAQMLLAIRRVLTAEQWKKLRAQPGIGPFPRGRGFGPPERGPEFNLPVPSPPPWE